MDGFDYSQYESMKNIYLSEKRSQLIQEIDKITITPEWTGDEAKLAILHLIKKIL